jgi:hypothetical protein
VIQSKKSKGSIKLTATAEGLPTATINLIAQ